jgi:hypothetical protein
MPNGGGYNRHYVFSSQLGKYVKKPTTLLATYDEVGEGMPYLIALFRFFPDFFLDIFHSDDADFELTFIQRIFLRINANYTYADITACRGATKSYCRQAGGYSDGLLWPGETTAVKGPSLIQTAKIASDIHKQIENNYPGLTALYLVESDSKSTFVVSTPFGSKISIDNKRGVTVHRATAEETAQEEKPPFDAETYAKVVIPAVRGEYRVNGQKSPAYHYFRKDSITSAGRRQQYAYEIRNTHRKMMQRGESAYVIDVPFDVILLNQMRPVAWAESIKNELTPAQWMREMESIYSGSDKNPIIRDEVLTESRCLLLMEEHHCCKDRDNKIKAEDVIYIVAYDVSFRDAKGNAKCACVILKLTKQDDYYHRDKYLKQVVWVEDWSPADTPTPMAQAMRVRKIWNRYTFDGSQTYIVIDANSYGDGVLTSLMEQPMGGGVPLCTYRHSSYTELELEGAIPVIYPIRAGGTGTTDPDSDMVLNAELQFEHGNVQLLTGDMNEGVESYKKYHRIKDDSLNYKISQPYKKTNELVSQIQNLREEPSGAGIKEKRISMHIQRDSWSALKYGLRFAQLLERANLQYKKQTSDWTKLLDKFKGKSLLGGAAHGASGGRTVTGRHGGRKY